MDFDIRQMQRRIVESQLFDQSATEILVANFESELGNENLNSENLVHWLCKQKAISAFQADILLADPNPRLQYGTYQLIDDIDYGNGYYLARHKLTQHLVRLRFFDGEGVSALESCQNAKSLFHFIENAPHENILKAHEAVSIKEFRFLVSAVPSGKKLPDLIPDKARLPVEKANQIIFQIADGLGHLFRNKLSADLDVANSTWVSKTGTATIDYPFLPQVNHQPGIPRQLAQLWYRLVSGRNAQPDSESGKLPKEELVRLKKYSLDTDRIKLLNSCYNDDKPTIVLLDKICLTLNDQTATKTRLNQSKGSQEAYLNWLQTEPGIVSLTVADEVPVVETGTEKINTIQNNEAINLADVTNPGPAAFKRKSSLLVPILGSIAVLATVIGLVVVLANQVPINNTVATNTDSNTDIIDPPEIDLTDSTTTPPSPPEPPTLVSFLDQRLIDDDQESLWESPTTGPPLPFANIPESPKIAISLRLHELLNSEPGTALVKSFGPSIESKLNNFSELTKVPLGQMEQLLITFHTNEDFVYDAFYYVKLAAPQTKQDLIERWQVEPKQFEDATYQFHDEMSCFAFTDNENDEVLEFVYGPEALIQNSVAYSNIDTTTGIMARLVAGSDERRHVTLLALRSGIFNDEGQKLMGQELLLFNQQLARSISNVVRGINLSLHLSNGSFIELRIDQSANLTPELMKDNISTLVQRSAENLGDYSSNMSSNPYWDRVRERVAMIADDFAAHFRLHVEDRSVVGNGWYPLSAAHNWVTAANLVLTYGESQFVEKDSVARPTRSVPATIEELLAAPRDLTVSTSPDLIVLMNNLQQEIKDDYGGLPFEFEIRLMGSDLVKEGITQNQRPSDLEMKQKPLSEILTEIMVKANPDKNITGADDVNCKLVWVIAPDPDEPDRKIVMITTRAAAIEKSYELPAAFQPKT